MTIIYLHWFFLWRSIPPQKRKTAWKAGTAPTENENTRTIS